MPKAMIVWNSYGLALLWCSLSHISSQSLPSMTNRTDIAVISDTEIFHLFATLILIIWIVFLMMLCYGIYLSVPNSCSLKSRLEGGRDQQMSHTLTVTIIATEPSVGYDYDNSSIRVDLCGRNDELIACLLMRPLWAFNSIQSDGEFKPCAPKKSPTSDVTDTATNNLSRQAPMIGIHKIISHKKLSKVIKIVIAHDCPHPDSTVLVRCLEIANVTSLICHTYPMNAYIPYLSLPVVFSYKSTEKYEFDSSHDIPLKIKYQANSTLNVIEKSVFWLLSINMIILGSYFWANSYPFESDEWLMWYKAVLLSLILGSLVASMHLILTVPYRLFKEYYVFHPTVAVTVFRHIIISIGELQRILQKS